MTTRSVRVRPQIGSSLRASMDEETVKYINLPAIDEKTIIGVISDTQVPICVSLKILLHHMMVAGSTGSGKTNVIANIASAAALSNYAVIILDHKPDYQDVRYPNQGRPIQEHFAGLENVSHWYIGEKYSKTMDETAVFVMAGDVDKWLLASSLFPAENEDLQRETLVEIIRYLKEQLGNGSGTWSCERLYEVVYSNRLPSGLSHLASNASFSAITRKLRRRMPSWLERENGKREGGALSEDGASSEVPPRFKIEDAVCPGRATVIRIGSAEEGGRDYGLLLSYIMKELSRISSGKRLRCPVLMVADEVQDIFDSGKTLRDMAIPFLVKQIRKGRSMGVGYVIGVQSALSIPSSVAQNLNSKVLHRHGDVDELRKAAYSIPDGLKKLIPRFGPGEAIVDMFGASSVVRAQMRLSPFQLTKEEME